MFERDWFGHDHDDEQSGGFRGKIAKVEPFVSKVRVSMRSAVFSCLLQEVLGRGFGVGINLLLSKEPEC